MNMSEWALIVFTILAQMSVGAFLVLGVLHFSARRAQGEVAADRLSNYSLLAIGPVLVLAMLASLLHLGNVFRAPRAILNLGSSWLSREIVFVMVFAALGFAFAIMQWRKIGSYRVRSSVAILTAIAGVGLVYSMARVYMIPNQPAWDMWTTPASFFTTTLLLGLFAIGAAFVVTSNTFRRKAEGDQAPMRGLLRSSLRGIAVAAVVLLGVQVLVSSVHLASLGGGNETLQATAALTVGQYGTLLVTRIALGFAGAGLLSLFIFQMASRRGTERFLSGLVLVAFAMVLVSEVVGRYLFYATQVNMGL